MNFRNLQLREVDHYSGHGIGQVTGSGAQCMPQLLVGDLRTAARRGHVQAGEGVI
jgi:hypothetical protein